MEPTSCGHNRPFHLPVWLVVVVDKEVAKFKAHGITLIMVADGCPHPMRLASEKRAQDHAENESAIRSLWAEGNLSDFLLVQKLKKRHGVVPAHLVFEIVAYLRVKHSIKTVCAPFQAEWQLAEMEKMGEIAGVCLSLNIPFLL